METFLPPACVPPVLSGVLRKDAHSVTVRLSPFPALLEAVEKGGYAGFGRLWPVSVQLQTQQHPAPVEGVVWKVVCDEMRYYPRPGRYQGAPCFLPGSAAGFPRDVSPKAGWLR